VTVPVGFNQPFYTVKCVIVLRSQIRSYLFIFF